MSNESFPKRCDSEIPESGARRIGHERTQFSDLFSRHTKDGVQNTGYSLHGDDITEATTYFKSAEQIASERQQVKDLIQARRKLRQRYRGAA